MNKKLTYSLFSILTFLITFFIFEKSFRYLTSKQPKIFDPFYYDSNVEDFVPEKIIAIDDIESSKPFVHFPRRKVSLVKNPAFKKRILMLGDSGTLGAGVLPNETFSHLLNQKFKDYEFINSGIAGLNTVSEYLYLKKYLLKLKPDIVILNIFMANDINFNYRQYKKSILREFPLSIIDNLRSSFKLLDFLYHEHLGLYKSKTDLIFTPGYVTSHNLQIQGYLEGEYATYLKGDDEVSKNMLGYTEQMFSLYKELELKENFDFIVTFLPTKSNLFNSLSFNWRSHPYEDTNKLGIDPKSFDFSFVEKRLIQKCTQLNIPYFSFLDELKKIKDNVHIQNDDHLTPEAHQVVANIIEENLQQMNILTK